MLYSHEHRFVYLAPPKTASTSLTEVLTSQFGAEWHEDRHDNRIPPEMSEYFVFATIRNPYRRAMSGYSHIVRRLGDVRLNDCWDRFHMISLERYFSSLFSIQGPAMVKHRVSDFLTPGKPPVVSAYLRTERLEEDFGSLPFVSGKVKIPVLNTSSEELPSAVVRRICVCVAIRYANDFHNYGYDIGAAPDGRLPLFC